MNNIYKVIWSKAKNCYVVASEIARSHTKSASSSEKIGGVTRRSLLASLMALSLLCGGLGVASAADGTVRVAESAATAGTAVVYTQEGTESYVQSELSHYAKASDTFTKSQTFTQDQVRKLINDLKTGDVATNKDNIVKLQAKTAKLSDDGTELTGMTTVSGTTVSGATVEAGALKVTGKISDGTVTTTLAEIDASMKQTDTNKADIVNLKTTTGEQDTAIKDLQKKTTNISYADGAGTSIDGITVKDGNIVGNGNSAITGLTNVETSQINGKSLAGTTVATATEVEAAVKAETDARTEADNKLEEKITKNSQDIATLDGKVTTAQGDIQTNANNIQANSKAIADTNKRTGGIARNLEDTQTTIEGSVKVDNKGNVKDVEELSAKKITTTEDAVIGGDLKVTGETTLSGELKAEKDATFEKNVTVEKDLTVNGKLNVDKISLKNDELKNGKKHDSATTITADEISNLAKVTEQGNTTESQFTHNEKGTFNYAKDEKSTGEWKRATSNVTADGVSNKMTDSDGNTHTYYQTAAETKEQLVNGDKSNFEKKTAEGNTISIKDKDADGNKKSLTNTQTVDGEKTSVTNKDSSSTINQGADQIRNYVASTDGTKSSTEVKADRITNTSDGTIINDAKDIVNNATGDMTNTVGGKLTTTVTGAAEETYKSGLKTDITGDETHTVTGKQTNTVKGGQENNISGGQKNNILTGDQETTVSNGSIINKAEHGDISNTAKNVTNEGTESVTNKVGNNEVKVSQNGVDIKAGDMTVTTDKTTGTTFGNGTPNDTTVINGGTIGTNKVNANETNTKKLTAGAAAGADGGRLTVDATDGVKGSYKSDKYTSKSYILANTLKSGVDNGKEPTEDGFVGSRTDHYMDGDKAKLDETVKDADGSNVTNKTSTSSNNTIADTNGNANTVVSTVDGTKFTNTGANTAIGEGTVTDTTIKGNTITTGKVTMDYADVMKDLGVRGKTTTGSLEVTGTSKLTGDVTMENNATVGKNLTVNGITTTKTLKVTENAEIDGNATIKGDVTARSYKVGDKTYISAAGINANDQKITNVADGSISEGSKDAVNGGQLYGVKNDLEGKVNKVGANAAAMANLHPMEFDPDSKWNIAAAIGNYGSETAAALGAFYRPNDDVMVNLSTAFGTGENMVGGGVSVRLGKGGNKLSREETNALKTQVADLTARMDALLSVLNPNMSKDFPDVPENHWAYEAVSRLAGNDIVQGYPDGEFHGERTMTRYEMAEIIYNALSRGAEAEKELVEEFKPELQAMAASEKATAEKAEG